MIGEFWNAKFAKDRNDRGGNFRMRIIEHKIQKFLALFAFLVVLCVEVTEFLMIGEFWNAKFAKDRSDRRGIVKMMVRIS
jgi:hypothetical protein